jgi:hypothetical protein
VARASARCSDGAFNTLAILALRCAGQGIGHSAKLAHASAGRMGGAAAQPTIHSHHGRRPGRLPTGLFWSSHRAAGNFFYLPCSSRAGATTWCVAQANHVQGVEILAYVTSHLSAVCKGSFFEVAISSQNATPKVHTAIEEPFCNVTNIVAVEFVSLTAFASASESVDVALTS